MNKLARNNNQLALADVLREFEENGTTFTAEMVAQRTAYSKNSINKYINEKLLNKYIFHAGSRAKYRIEGISALSNDEFLAVMSQSAKTKQKKPEEQFHDKLVSRSLDAFTLALEVYNRPSMKNRVEAFAIMMVNAWELLLKAEILKAEGYEKIFNDGDRSISISDAVKRRLQEKDPVRINLETIIDLRDHAIHLLIPELQPQLSRLFQATVLNYQTRYRHEMGNAPLAGQSVGMLSLVVDGPAPEVALIQKLYGKHAAQSVSKFIKRFDETSKTVDSTEFSIPVDYRLALVKREDESDLSLSVGDAGEGAIIITKTKDPDATHPYHTKETLDEINKRQAIISIKSGAFQAVLNKHKINYQTKSDMRWVIDGRPRYSEKFIRWFVDNLKQPKWLESAKEFRRNQLRNKR
ncbi:hypothetical protein NCCP2140_01860 [Pseudoalteromonas sp. NCCP-2140]|uniref:DUF3644 domain-containing protein n=1 Tax=Pseudoalteromonas sp. NCCP-2140 TaxID=2942288 RepID=UPI00203F1FD2|nr:DUF3644 domain-containing protein [Pseudoalteromonas sp. NCCP-2140]GKW51133.1 hypothetical protein NCCP2140_01860 [Pseudoalteromonas sp. NCCP-2140]